MGWNNPQALRSNNFDFLRFALASLVIFAHSFALIDRGNDNEPLMRLTGGSIDSGALAVNGFFVLSGFLITYSYMRGKGVVDFFRKRALRIYPGFMAAVSFCAFFVAPVASSDPWGAFSAGQLGHYVQSILFLQTYKYAAAFPINPFHALNGSLWSISFEWWCYVGVAVLGVLGLLKYRRLVLGLFVASLVGSLAFSVFELNPGGHLLGVIFGAPKFWARLLPYYLAGMVFCHYREVIPYSWKVALGASFVLVASVFVSHALVVTLPIAGTYLLFWVGFSTVFRVPRWAAHGDFSYGIYLYAFPLQQLLLHYIPRLNPLGLLALSLPLSIFFGFLSWHVVEKRFMAKKTANVATAGVMEGGHLGGPGHTAAPTVLMPARAAKEEG